MPEALYPEIAANRAQYEEWVELFSVDEIEGDLTNGGTVRSDPPTIAFLKANPYLVLDTRHFDRDFTGRLLAALSDTGPLDEQTDGLLVHGENFQALNLLQARYRGQVQCVYIDPPYNTNGDGFVYRDSYQHSSWLSMLKNRLSIARDLLSRDGVFFSSINDIEHPLLRLLLDERFGTANRIANMVWKAPRTTTRLGLRPSTNTSSGMPRIFHRPLLYEESRQRCKRSDVGGMGTTSRLVRRAG